MHPWSFSVLRWSSRGVSARLGPLGRLLALLVEVGLGLELLGLGLLAHRLELLAGPLLLDLPLLDEAVVADQVTDGLLAEAEGLVGDAAELVEVDGSDSHARVVPALAR